MDVLLVDNLFVSQTDLGPSTSFYPHLGLMSIAAELNAAGIVTRILDPKLVFRRHLQSGDPRDFDQSLLDAVQAHSPRVVGFTAYGLNFHHVTAWVRALRRAAPPIRIILGGPHVSMLAREVADFLPEADWIVCGECESRIVALMVACLSGSTPDLPGTSKRNGVTISAGGNAARENCVRSPDLGLYVETPAFELASICMPIEAGRGCPYDCTFCSTAEYFGRRYRTRSPAELVGEMRDLNQRFGIHTFDLTHDLFGLQKPFVREFCERAEPLGVSWQCSMRPDQISQTTIDQLVRGGCSGVYMGFETGSPALQSSIKKRLDLASAIDAAERLMASPIGVTCSFITGFPDETSLDVDLTLDLIGRLLMMSNGRMILQLHLLSPEPGSALGREKTEFLRFDGIGPDLQPVARRELVASHPTVFANHFYLESAAGRFVHVLASLFVMNTLPDLGYPFAAWLVRETAGGELSALVRDIAVDLGPVTAEGTGALRESLLQRCYARAAMHVGDDALIEEYARFRSAVRHLSSRGESVHEDPRAAYGYVARRNVAAFAYALDKGLPFQAEALEPDVGWSIRFVLSGGEVRVESTPIAHSL